jgi:fatty acid synthase subunit alpha
MHSDAPKLVHLSNGFRMVEGAGPLQVGEVCRAEARIASVTNTEAGKVVKVKGHVYREDKPVIEVVSSFSTAAASQTSEYPALTL